jgi:hypothetical protein
MRAAGHTRLDPTWLYTITDQTREEEQLGRMWDRLVGQAISEVQ